MKATAGLRSLPGSQSKDTLGAVERRLREPYEFPLAEKELVRRRVMDGKERVCMHGLRRIVC